MFFIFFHTRYSFATLAKVVHLRSDEDQGTTTFFFDIFGRGPESIPSDHLAALREQWRRGLPKWCEVEGGSEVKDELW